MSILAAICIAMIGTLVAAALERLLRQYHRKLKDDCGRINAAKSALEDQERIIDRILDRKTIPENIRTFVVEVAEIIPSQESAYRLAAWVDSGMPNVDNEPENETELNEFYDNLRTLRQVDEEGFELVNIALRGSFVTTMLQWPTTARSLQRLYYKFAVESSQDVVKSAAAVHRAARHEHWSDPTPQAA
jgi:hypothetical protein